MIDINEIARLVVRNIASASRVADAIQLNTRNFSAKTATMVADMPAYRKLPLGYATKTWAATLFVDLRDSTERAMRIGARDTFITMQAYIPAIAQVIGDTDGYIVGFRGDGIFAAFGLDERDADERGSAVMRAASCGKAMIDVTQKVINPALCTEGIEGDLRIGVGIDIGEIVVTRIGLPGSFDVTAYGNSVNRAAHLADDAVNQILVSTKADEIYPCTPNGRVRSRPAIVAGAVALHFPTPYLPEPDWEAVYLLDLMDN